ncbi:hypothetical protein PICST_34041 [Scheffersomyces stipitis CBS 6054]|uniref:Uncharacterized protein n=1 Tax=Scheffersomyces stipitis (strain ATCC 58785 / CBS 6054 / NBRC 10063 / NRRL Y-11545) TaxID=322104 RepID=A3GF14_PICST|nr:predicted protein [Scheffersomyces stipitis CBS 6054]EAZ63267.1 hypothetical protein PICST_34041 [Scheffersomyces stipitis CBS 6054]KAG2731646.1 hypothetical protein G9P44_005233 [Scheffersomyces stipitis]
MAIFRSKSAANKTPQLKISAKDEEHYKMHSVNVHDPILTAVNEAQPFEQAAARDYSNRRPSYLSQDSNDLKDIFGNNIKQSDMSNPTRARNERPLDTIRGFEYAITGEVSYRDQLESQRLGWGFHEDFPHYNLQADTDGAGTSARPVINFNNVEQPVYQAGNYSATSLKPEGKKKKKGGLFSRKK